MRFVEIVFAALLICALVGCSQKLSFEELVGQYETTNYPSLTKAVLVLNPDCTYNQFFIYQKGDTLRNGGTWQYVDDTDYDRIVELNHGIDMRISYQNDAVAPDTFDVVCLGPRKILWTISIEVNPDYALVYKKVSQGTEGVVEDSCH